VVRTIRVALFQVNPRLRSILTDAVAREDDVELVPCQFAVAGGASDVDVPDAVVCEIEDPLDITLPDQLLRAMPRGRVLLVAETGDQAAVYELEPARRVFLNVSIAQLIDAIRNGLGRREN